MKPYRLVNQSELAALSARLEPMRQLLFQYAADCEIRLTKSVKTIKQSVIVFSDNQSLLAMVEAEQCDAFAAKMLKTTDKHPLYRQFAIKVLSLALNAFFAIDHITAIEQSQIDNHFESNWLYRGAPLLSIEIELDGCPIELTINPDWLIAQLPPVSESEIALAKPAEILSSQPVKLTANLSAFHCRLNTLMALQVGDVLQTAHPVTKELDVMATNKTLIAKAIPGRINRAKAIQIIEENDNARD